MRQGAVPADHAYVRDDVAWVGTPPPGTAIQVQCLKRFGAPLGFGVLFTTAILEVVVPAFYTIHLHLLSE